MSCEIKDTEQLQTSPDNVQNMGEKKWGKSQFNLQKLKFSLTEDLKSESKEKRDFW